MKRFKYIWILVMLGISVISCQNNEDKIKINKDVQSVGLNSKVRLEVGTTQVFLEDYFLNIDQIDSVSADKGLNLRLSADKKFLYVDDVNAAKLSTVSVWIDGVPNGLLLLKSEKQRLQISYKDEKKKAKSVQLKGEMNAWNPVNSNFVYKDGVWSWTVDLNPGKYQYLFVIDGKEMLDPANDVKIDNSIGGFNSLLEVELPGKTKAPSIRTEKYGAESFEIAIDGKTDGYKVFWQNYLLNDHFVKKGKNKLLVSIPENAREMKRSFIRVFAYNEGGVSNDLLIPLESGEVLNDYKQIARDDYEAAIFYFMMIDRFVNGNTSNDEKVDNDEILAPANYYGGDIAGVTAKLKDGYFDQLGVNTIWVSPITQNPKGAYGLWKEPRSRFSGYHGYWPVSSTKIDYRFGTEAELRELLDLAHSKNYNVVIDYVANHVHENHPVYKLHPDWATDLYLPDGSLNTMRWDDHRLTTWFDTFLPTLNLERNEVAQPMSDSALFWIEEFGFDGIRHDATKHIPVSFQRILTRKLKQQVALPKSKRIYQIGETYGSPELINSYVNSGMLDAQFNFNLYDAAVAAFAKNDETFARLKDVLQQSLNIYGNHHLMGNISGNQDRARFISYASGDLSFAEDAKLAGWTRKIGVKNNRAYGRLKMLQAFNMTIPGIPVIYYGDEIGMPGGNDPDNRRMMRFENLKTQEVEVKAVVEKLTALRKTKLSLIYGDLEILQDGAEHFVYQRNYFDQYAIVAFNKSDEQKEIKITLSESIGKKSFKAEFGSKLSYEEGVLTITLPANSFDVLFN